MGVYHMQKILISACLLGQNVRYDGENNLCQHPILKTWMEEGCLVSICPEVSAGLPTPRPSCEIIGEGGGFAVLKKKARVVSRTNIDRTTEFRLGAEKALQLAQKHNIVVGILKSNSPSCGNVTIYDGTYSGKLKSGMGVTAALLTKHGIKVFNENQLQEAKSYIKNVYP